MKVRFTPNAQEQAGECGQPVRKMLIPKTRHHLYYVADFDADEPVYVQLVDGVIADDRDDLDDEERAALHRELDASIAEADAGETEDFAQVLAELRQRQ